MSSVLPPVWLQSSTVKERESEVEKTEWDVCSVSEGLQRVLDPGETKDWRRREQVDQVRGRRHDWRHDKDLVFWREDPEVWTRRDTNRGIRTSTTVSKTEVHKNLGQSQTRREVVNSGEFRWYKDWVTRTNNRERGLILHPRYFRS